MTAGSVCRVWVFLCEAEGFGILAARRDRTVRYRTQDGDIVENIERELAAGAFALALAVHELRQRPWPPGNRRPRSAPHANITCGKWSAQGPH